MKQRKTILSNINIVDIAPITIGNTIWYCIGFEPKNVDMGDHFHLALFHDNNINKNSKNLLKEIKDSLAKEPVLLRIHSECILGDCFGSSLCDCRLQLENAINLIIKNKLGLILYLRQEGRGIGFRAKLSCLALQEGFVKGKRVTKKYTPDEANIALGYGLDRRDYSIAVQFLKSFNIDAIKIISGNPDKIKALHEFKVEIIHSPILKLNKRLTKRQLLELTEKVERGYYYPEFANLLKRNTSN